MTVAIFFLAASLVAASHAAEAPSKPASGITAKDVAAKTTAEGKTSICDGRAIELLGLPQKTPCKILEFSDSQTSDGIKRSCRVFEADKSKAAKPLSMLWSSEISSSKNITVHYFKIGLDGRWEGSYTLQTQLDDAGKAIASTAVYSYLDALSSNGKSVLEHEREFWLKGMYRKAAKAKSK